MKSKLLLIPFSLCGALALPVAAIPSGASSNTVLENGLEWLRPNWTIGISYQDMMGRLASPGSDYYGFRFATIHEVTGLATYRLSGSSDTSSGTGSPSWDETPAPAMILEADTIDVRSIDWGTAGYVWEDYSDVDTFGVGIGTFYRGSRIGDTIAELWTISKYSAGPEGSWLVRVSVVPEPQSLWLISLGLVGIAASQRRKL